MAPPPMVCPDDPLATETRPPQAWEGDHEKLAKDIAGAVCIQTFEVDSRAGWPCDFMPYFSRWQVRRLQFRFGKCFIHLWCRRCEKGGICQRAHTNAIADCRFSLDGHYLCTAGWDEVVKLWDIRTGEFRSHGPIILDQGHIGIVGCCDISKDASLVVSGGYDKTIVIWDSREAYKKLCLKGHAGWVTDIALSSNKKWLVSASKDCTLRVWDVADAHEVPVVVQAIRTRGSKLAKCEECKKSFLLFHNDEDKVEINCVFCRLASYKESVPPDPPPLPPLPPDF
uniref:WD repeat-containing protein 88 isoform X5 n=1 Tax=Podarcis muralis TaxID=64176 RepID=UPI0010A01161|nr:WD repeat-containing protein 88 isoform X5 [Podarcis muralis]